MTTSRTVPSLPEEVGMGDGEEGMVVLRLPVKDPTFDLANAVCNHGLFMMAPNGWDPDTASLRRPLHLSSSSASLCVRVSQPSPHPDHLLVSVYCTTFLSSQDQDAILSQVQRMLRMSNENDRMIKEFHTIHAAAKERGFGRIFRSPTLFEDMVKCILLCNCRWPRTLSMAKALCELQLELKCCTISRDLYPKTPQLRDFKRKRQNTTDVIAKSDDKSQENGSNLAQKAMSFFHHSNHSNNSQRMETSTVGETDSIYDFEGLPIINKLDASSPVCQLSSGILCLPNTQGNFPSPEELANVDVNYLASRCKLGYRSQWIVSLAQDIVEHKIQFSKLEEICNGSTLYSYDELDKELSGIHGFGPFTRANILMCMGFYHKIPSDSETIRHLKQFHSIKNCTVRSSRKNLEAIYGKFAPFQFLAYWFEMWTCYEEIFGKMTQMPPSKYQIVTGINMKVSEIKK
ncbi:uncharacterized protein LOC135671178 [Musa acuminata AAA Group]|uniref:uncharacterized protein LOC135671178 n=1 Tax=Musa acuminata AAA Group TaxID=214697 RepID=UPI0031E1348C